MSEALSPAMGGADGFGLRRKQRPRAIRRAVTRYGSKFRSIALPARMREQRLRSARCRSGPACSRRVGDTLLLPHHMGLNPRRQRPLLDPPGGHVFHYHHGFSKVGY